MNAGIARRAFSYLRPYRLQLWIGQAALLIAAAAGLVLPLCSRLLLNGLTGFRSSVTVGGAVALLAASFLVLAAAGYVKDTMLGAVGQRVMRDLRRELYGKLPLLSLPSLDATSSGELVSVMTNDVNLFQQAVAGGVMFVLTQALSALAVTAIMIGLDAPLTLMLCGVIPAAAVVSRWTGNRGRAITTRVQKELGGLTAVISETIRGLDVVKAFVLRREAQRIFQERSDRATEGSLRAITVRAQGSALVSLLGGLSLVLVVGVGCLHVASGRITPGDLVAYIVYAQMIVGPIGTLSGIWVDVQSSFAAGKRIFGVLDADAEPAGGVVRGPAPAARALVASVAPRAAAKAASRQGAAVSCREVWFRYAAARGGTEDAAPQREPASGRLEEAALRGLTLDIEPGQSVALVGPSGAGKSTLLKLLLRFYAPDRGQLLMDGVPLEDYDVEELRRDIALVMQETHLFDMSARDNILCGDPGAGEAQASWAARKARAHEFVVRLPDGYDTPIGENGARLSGGQRQRIALARAFLRKPRLLLLDEATSALDTESERAVQAAMDRIMKGRTTVCIAHRLSTVRRMDRICVMDRGRIVDAGTHAELLRRSPLYQRLNFAGGAGRSPRR